MRNGIWLPQNMYGSLKCSRCGNTIYLTDEMSEEPPTIEDRQLAEDLYFVVAHKMKFCSSCGTRMHPIRHI